MDSPALMRLVRFDDEPALGLLHEGPEVAYTAKHPEFVGCARCGSRARNHAMVRAVVGDDEPRCFLQSEQQEVSDLRLDHVPDLRRVATTGNSERDRRLNGVMASPRAFCV